MASRPIAPLVLAALLAACETSDTPLIGPGFVCDVTNPVREIIVPADTVLAIRTPPRDADTLRIPVTVTNRFGRARTDVPIFYTSSDPSVLVVDSTGLVRAVSEGVAQVTVASCGVEEVVQIRTVRAFTASTLVTADRSTLVLGDSVVVSARSISQLGTPLGGVTFTWTTTGAAAQLVPLTASTALVRPTATGTVVVRATGDGVSGTTALTVLPAP